MNEETIDDEMYQANNQLKINFLTRHLLDENRLNTDFTHITHLYIDTVIPSLIHGPHGLHMNLQFPPNLVHLSYTRSLLTAMPTGIPDSVTSLDLSGNRIPNIGHLPPGLLLFSCGDNYITDFLVLPDTILLLSCCNNPITRFPNKLPSSLTHLDCSGCELIELPELPASLEVLNCSGNPFQFPLPTLPPKLHFLSCARTQLTELPDVLPSSLAELYCRDNWLKALPELPPRLQILDCQNNCLTWLPELPESLCELSCNNNQLVWFSSRIPDRLAWLDCRYNPQLKWLPPLPAIMCYLKLDTVYMSFYHDLDNELTADMLEHANVQHKQIMQRECTKRMDIYRTELHECQLAITLNPDRISRLLKTGELCELGDGRWADILAP